MLEAIALGGLLIAAWLVLGLAKIREVKRDMNQTTMATEERL